MAELNFTCESEWSSEYDKAKAESDIAKQEFESKYETKWEDYHSKFIMDFVILGQ